MKSNLCVLAMYVPYHEITNRSIAIKSSIKPLPGFQFLNRKNKTENKTNNNNFF